MICKPLLAREIKLISVILIRLAVFLSVGAVIGVSSYLFYGEPKNIEYDEVSGGEISMTYTDDQNIFGITNGVKMSDTVGMAQDASDKFFDFTINTDISNANNLEYSIILVKDETLSTSLDENVKIYLEKEVSGSYSEVTGPIVFSPNMKDSEYENAMTIYKGTNRNNKTENFRLRMWISDTANITPEQIQNFAVKIMVDGKAN